MISASLHTAGLALVALLVLPLPATADGRPDPWFGEALYYAHQDRWFDALQRLDLSGTKVTNAGLMQRPTSWAIQIFGTRKAPVSGSTSTSTMHAEYEYAGDGPTPAPR